MKVCYWGPLASGVVGNGPAFDFVRGEAIEVPDDFARPLLEQGPEWRDVSESQPGGGEAKEE